MNQAQLDSSRSLSVFWPAVFAAAGVGLVAPVLYFGIYKFTHHRPLGAATLAVLSLAAFLFLFVVAWRLKIGRTVALSSVVVTAIGLVVTAVVG